MAGVRYDFRGRLLSLYVVPPSSNVSSPPPSPTPTRACACAERAERGERHARRRAGLGALFAEAAARPCRPSGAWSPCGLRPSTSTAARPGRVTGPRGPDLTLRVEAASYRGRPVWFETRSPWSRPEREQARQPGPGYRRTQAFYVVSMVLLVSVGGVLAYRNISLGRGDRRGAFRLALALVTMGTAAWVVRAHHVADPAAEMGSFAKGAGFALLVACLVWVFYLALEPYVRRLRPWTLVSWTRLLNGGFRDAVVGRDVLVGLAFGTYIALLNQALRLLPERPPDLFGVDALLSTGILLSHVVGRVVNAVLGGLALLLLFLILRLATRRDWIAAVLVVAFLISGEFVEAVQSKDSAWLVLLLAVMAWGAFVAAAASRSRHHGHLDGRHAAGPGGDLCAGQLDGCDGVRSGPAAAGDGRAVLPQRDVRTPGRAPIPGRRALELGARVTLSSRPLNASARDGTFSRERRMLG